MFWLDQFHARCLKAEIRSFYDIFGLFAEKEWERPILYGIMRILEPFHL